MAIVSVQYTSEERLSCSCNTPAEVILCVNPAKVRPLDCTPGTGTTTFEFHTIPATLMTAVVSATCPTTSYLYTFAYSDEDVVIGETILSEDIEGVVCKGCVTTYIEDLAGNEVQILTDGDEQTLVTQHGCEYVLESGGGVGVCLNNFIFGDGSDGSVTILNGQDEGIPFPARTVVLEDVTIDAGGIFHPYGYNKNDGSGDPYDKQYYQILINGTLTINGTLSVSGANGANAVGNLAVSTTDIQAIDGSGGGDEGGGPGGNGALVANGTAGSPNFGNRGMGAGYAAGGVGGNGGAGGSATGTGGAGGINTNPDNHYDFNPNRILWYLFDYSSGGGAIGAAIGGGSGGAGGGGGGMAAGANFGGGGGEGGAAAGSIWIAARNIVIGPTGSIVAIGGDGGDGANGSAPGAQAAGGGGAGGGGGGGLVYLIYENFTNNGNIDVSGGAAGAPGNGVNGGANGANGVAGTDGTIVRLNLTTGNFE